MTRLAPEFKENGGDERGEKSNESSSPAEHTRLLMDLTQLGLGLVVI